MKNLKIIVVIAAMGLLGAVRPVFAQGTAFTYQGRLNDGANPAAGVYDLRFTIYDSTNLPGVVIAGPLTNSATAVSNGLFTVTLDFGPGVFTGPARWLEIGVRTNGATSFATLAPRQSLTPVPYAIMASSASNLLGTVSAAQLSGTIPPASLSGSYGNAVNFNNGANGFDGTFVGTFFGGSFTGGNFNGNFFGNGGGLFNLDASLLGSGTVPDAQLAGNVARTNQVWLLNGNTGTMAGTNFVGTTDNQPLIIKVNGVEAERYEPTTDTPNVVGGYSGNYVQPGLPGVTIGGGGTGIGNQPNIVTNNGFYATIAGGYHNTVTNYGGAILGGSVNFAGGNFAVIGGGQFHTSLSDYTFIGGGYNNQISADAKDSIIGGGEQNSIQGDAHVLSTYGDVSSTIAGGERNAIQTNSAWSIISGGILNQIQPYALGATVGGGYANTIQGNSNFWAFFELDSSTIGGGAVNTIQTNAAYSTIAGGLLNVIQANASWSSIAGGVNNANGSASSTIGGGWGNIIQTNASDSTIGGGNNNVIQAGAGWSVIAGGSNNITGGNGATVPGGLGNTASGMNSFAAGTDAQATNDGAFVLTDDQPTNFYSTASNQLSARFTGGVRFVTGGAGMTLDGQPILAGSVNAGQLSGAYTNVVTLTNSGNSFAGNGTGLTNVNAATLNGLSSGSFAPASGSGNYIQNQTASPQAAAFNINGSAQIAGLLRSGAENGTTEGPNPAGLVIRRINSTSTTSNSVVAISHISGNATNVTLIRDGTSAGFQIQYPASASGRLTIACMGIDNTGAQKNFYTSITAPAAPGAVQVFTNSQNIVHFECSFGDPFSNTHLTQVTLTRYTTDFFWDGTVISTVNQ